MLFWISSKKFICVYHRKMDCAIFINEKGKMYKYPPQSLSEIAETHLYYIRSYYSPNSFFLYIILTYVASRHLLCASIVWSHVVCHISQKMYKITKKK